MYNCRVYVSICVNRTNELKKMASGLELANVIFASILAPYPTNMSTKEYGRPNIIFTCVLPWDLVSHLEVININSWFSFKLSRDIGIFA
jgi:hypothetical protein